MIDAFGGLVCWVTGGGSGIGRALALELGRRGAIVVVSGRRVDRLHETVDMIEHERQRAFAFPCDVCDEAQVADTIDRIIAACGRIDVVVANAGFGVAAPFESVDAATWRRQLEVNVVGVAVTIRASLDALRKTRGRIVVVSSVMGKLALAGSAPYVASKHALVGLCNTLHQELHGSGVTVTNLLPGLVESEIAQVDNEGVYRPDRKDKRPRRWMWPADRAAVEMADAIGARVREHVITGHGKVGALLAQHMPGLTYWVLSRAGVRSRG